MRVVLIRDVKDVGRAHETVETRDGYALNYLIPQKFAVPATAGAVKGAEVRRAHSDSRKKLDAALFAERLAALADGSVTILKKANEKGHLYDAVSAAEIAEAAKLPEEAIKLEKPLKELGTFRVPIALGETFGEFSITISAE